MKKFFKVSLISPGDWKFVDIAAEDEEKAKYRAIKIFPIKYPHLRMLDTDNLIIREETEDEFGKSDKGIRIIVPGR
jgi:hypothetical protein